MHYLDTFYLIGGHTGGANVNTIYKHEPKTGQWTLLPYRLSSAGWDMPVFLINREAFKK